MKSIKDYYPQIQKAKELIQKADAIMVGAGAGMSTASGFDYDGERFEKNFSDFIEKYQFPDMYTAGFYKFKTLEEQWAYWSRFVNINRYNTEAGDTYKVLFEIIKDKDYFVLTTNVDHQFQISGFSKERLFYTQGDYGLFQCSVPCHDKTYDNKEIIEKMVREQKNMKIPSELIPYCPKCGRAMSMNLRADHTFVEDEGWKAAAKRYHQFLEQYKDRNIIYLELGVGFNTPGIIKYPFLQHTIENPKAHFIQINLDPYPLPKRFLPQSIVIKGDLKEVLMEL